MGRGSGQELLASKRCAQHLVGMKPKSLQRVVLVLKRVVAGESFLQFQAEHPCARHTGARLERA